MRSVVVFLALFAVAASAVAPLLAADSETAIPDNYIVVFKPSVSPIAREAHIRRVKGLGSSNVRPFTIGDFSGYAAVLVNNTLSVVLSMPEVAHVEADQVVTASQTCVTQQPVPSWGLTRISEVELLLNGAYKYGSDGTGVNIYIVDTGIYLAHNDYKGRVTWGANFADSTNDDCNGHGTHVAGTAAGTTYGVAKKASLIAVKVLDCQGSGTNAGVIQGIQYVATKHTAGSKPSVANLSLGGSYSATVNSAVAAAVKAGVVFAVAAGNSNANACSSSPASEPTAISVGSSDTAEKGISQIDIRSSFSNFGTCVHVFAPGSDITSSWIGGVNAQNTISGTSMASPHIAGISARILSSNPAYTPAQVKTSIVNQATSGVITLNCGTNSACLASPNKLSFIGC